MSVTAIPRRPGAASSAAVDVRRVTLRESVAGDAELMLELYAATSERELQAMGWTLGDQPTFVIMQAQTQEWKRARRYPHLDRLVICVDGEPAGRLLVSCETALLEIVDIALLPRYRGRGIGTHLLAQVLEEARATRVPVQAAIAEDNKALVLFGRLGFTASDESDGVCTLTWRPPLALVPAGAREEAFVRGSGVRAHRSAES